MNLPSLVCLIDNQGRVIEANAAVSRWGGYADAGVAGKTPHGLLHSHCDSDTCVVHRKWLELWRGMRTNRRQSCVLTDPVCHRRLRLSATRVDIPEGDVAGVADQYGIVRILDIGPSRRHARRQDGSRSDGEAHANDRAIAEAVTRERHRIAAELHDGISQQLALMKLQVEGRLARGLSGDDVSSAEDLLQHLVGELQGTLREIRKLNGSLMADPNDRFGLVSRLRQLCDNADRVRPATRVTFESPLSDADFLPARCGEQLPLAVYRVTQEAVCNALKHADARALKIRLFPYSGSQWLGELTLSIQDDGRGLDAGQADPDRAGSGLGLTTMRQRALETGGELSVLSPQTGGTEVRVSWPMVLRAI